MSGAPHLLTDVKFSERRRGYAPEEVDNFLERVSAAVTELQARLRDATARAEQAEAAKRIAEAQVEQLVAEIVQLRVDGAAAHPPSSPG